MVGRIRRAFTLVELLGVISIIAILMIFVLVAAQGANRDAQRENTRSLIVKLDNAMNQLIEQVLASRINPSPVHVQWAAGYQNVNGNPVLNALDKGVMQRAQVLANYDEMRAQVPDAFFVQVPDPTNNYGPGVAYPINFAQQPFTGAAVPYNYCLPLGINSPAIIGNAVPTPGTGIYGASYGAAAGLLKNLGNVAPEYIIGGGPPIQFLAQGADGGDNNQNNLIDDSAEGLGPVGSPDPQIVRSVAASLTQHKHAAARSEILYALLVEGQSQFGAFLNKDDFTSGQIGDVDHDGLPEFLDAWGNPLQFYRWPTMYHSDVQKGILANPAVSPCNASDPPGPYAGVFEPREQDPMDPNQLLMSPNWWSSQGGMIPWGGLPQGANAPLSAEVMTFQYFFHWLTEPLDFNLASASPCMFWDRSGAALNPPLHPRRAFYTRFLILSGGPDGIPGVPILDDQTIQNYVASNNAPAAAWAIQLESAAAQYNLAPMIANLNGTFATFFGGTAPNNADPTTGGDYATEGLDDITNHNLNSTSQVSAQ